MDKTKHINTQGTPTQMLQMAPDTFYLREQQKQHATPDMSNKERESYQPRFNMIDIELLQEK